MTKTLTALGLLACLVRSAIFADAQTYATSVEIGSCDDLVTAAAALSVGNVVGQLTATEISCSEWTEISVAQNKLKLDGGDDTYMMNNVRFVVSSDAILRVDVDIDLTGDDAQMVHGGVLNVADGGKARFLGDVEVHDVHVTSTEDEKMNGGCVYNQGYVRFEGEFEADGCKTVAADGIVPGSGSGIWNGEGARIIFKQRVNMHLCGEAGETPEYSGHHLGGAVYTAGKMSFFEDATFGDNGAEAGGGMYIDATGEVKFLKRSRVVFTAVNRTSGSGGHVFNMGNLVCRGETLFADAIAGGSGGAIYNRGGRMTFVKHVTFTGNSAGGHGGAIWTSYEYVDDLPTDYFYTANRVLYPDWDYECNNVYVGLPEEDGYECRP